MATETTTKVIELLGEEGESLLSHHCETIPSSQLYLPGPDFVDAVWADSDRSPRVLRAMQSLFNHGRLARTGYLSILPVDQGVEHSGGASFAPNPMYFDPVNIAQLAVEGGCNGVASTFGVLSAISRKFAHRIPMILKLNHNELLSYPTTYDQIPFARVRDAWNMGCLGVGATVYFGSPESARQIQEVSDAFAEAHDLGMFTMLWCYLRNGAFTVDGTNYEASADLTGQANHLGCTIKADFIKQKQPTNNGGYRALNQGGKKFGKYDDRIYDGLSSDNPIDLTRYQILNCYMGRCGLINSGGGSGANDLQQVVRTAVINKRAGGMGLISGRKAFQRPIGEGIELFNAIQDVYLDPNISVA